MKKMDRVSRANRWMRYLRNHRACLPARRFVKGKTFAESVARTRKSDWLMWLTKRIYNVDWADSTPEPYGRLWHLELGEEFRATLKQDPNVKDFIKRESL